MRPISEGLPRASRGLDMRHRRRFTHMTASDKSGIVVGNRPERTSPANPLGRAAFRPLPLIPSSKAAA